MLVLGELESVVYPAGARTNVSFVVDVVSRNRLVADCLVSVDVDLGLVARPTVRANIVVCLGDLLTRHPNTGSIFLYHYCFSL